MTSRKRRPFDIVCRFSDEEPPGVDVDLYFWPRVDGDGGLPFGLAPHLECDEQQVQLDETQPACN